jgi:ligand-binding sensor domain-containing protein
MKVLLSFILTCLLMLGMKFCIGQNKHLEFNLVEPPSGMHPGTLTGGVQDAQGYMWIGAYQSPLRRYDGYKYTFYSNDPSNPNTLGGTWIQSLCASRTGDIWIGTKKNGLDKLDPATGKFRHYRFDDVKNLLIII